MFIILEQASGASKSSCSFVMAWHWQAKEVAEEQFVEPEQIQVLILEKTLSKFEFIFFRIGMNVFHKSSLLPTYLLKYACLYFIFCSLFQDPEGPKSALVTFLIYASHGILFPLRFETED